ncbi:MAG: lipopolysaccharide transport periplasmic protein LptA [Desulfobulbaceae bacterium]|nr:lipopolysaccharide transport periplasmic protein LptA [Desulfobulbaceae bacterium]
MESKQQSNTVIFSGKVEAKQGDLFIRADDMEVKYQAQGKKGAKASGTSPRISKIVAKGNIEIRNQGWVASGDALEFFEQERKVLLTGNAKVWQDNNMVTGERILLYLDEGKSVIEKSEKKGERVKAFFYPQAGTGGQETGDRRE